MDPIEPRRSSRNAREIVLPEDPIKVQISDRSVEYPILIVDPLINSFYREEVDLEIKTKDPTRWTREGMIAETSEVMGIITLRPKAEEVGDLGSHHQDGEEVVKAIVVPEMIGVGAVADDRFYTILLSRVRD